MDSNSSVSSSSADQEGSLGSSRSSQVLDNIPYSVNY